MGAGMFLSYFDIPIRGWNRAEKLNILAESSVTLGAEKQLTQMIRSLPLLLFYISAVLILSKFKKIIF